MLGLKRPIAYTAVLLGILATSAYLYCTFITPKIKNVIVMIGDGMGPQQMSLAIQYAKQAKHSVIKDRILNMERFINSSEVGMMTTHPYGNLVTDSAASATQLSIGKLSRSEMIGLDKDGNAHETALEKAKRMGKAMGLVTNTRLTHATPAGFSVHQAHRSMENEVAVDLLKLQPDVMLAGGLRHFLPKNLDQLETSIPSHIRLKSKRKDKRNLLQEAKLLGYDLLFSKRQLLASSASKILGIFAHSELPDAIDYYRHKDQKDFPFPTLQQMTQKALSVLSKNKNGFFLMIESGLIDYAGHFNDTGWMLHEMLEFDQAIGSVYEWAKNRKDTLVILTADHETGGFGFSYSKYEIPSPMPLPGKHFQKKPYAPQYDFGKLGILDKIHAQKMPFLRILDEFEELAAENQSPASFQKLVNKYSEFKITLEDAQNALKREPNMYYRKGHKHLKVREVPIIHDFKEYYVYGRMNMSNLIGRYISKDQHVVWATGSHTSTPVFVVAHGPQTVTKDFDGLHHSSDIGKLILKNIIK